MIKFKHKDTIKIIYNITKFHNVQMFENRGSMSIITRKSKNSNSLLLQNNKTPTRAYPWNAQTVEIRELKKRRRRDDDDASHPRKTGSRVWFSEGKFEG